jgi:hypothetical protein
MCSRTPQTTIIRVPARRKGVGRQAAARLVVHVALLASVATSLIFEPMVTLHIALGLLFVGLVIAHLAQRRRTTRRLLEALAARRPLSIPAVRLAWSDALLGLLTAVMLGSGLWDWLAGPTHIRWHAISGVALAVVLGVHTVRRRRRLTRSGVT